MAAIPLHRLVAALSVAAGLAAPAAAESGGDIQSTLVFIECTGPDDQTSRGSGALVSAEGHVLTAAYVAPPGSTCKGSIGVADPNIATRLVPQPLAAGGQVAVLRFQRGGQDFLKVCQLTDAALRETIIYAGFPSTDTGVPSFTSGILSTLFTDAQGLISTDGTVSEGMGGGPVLSEGLDGLVGIIWGTEFSPLGIQIATKVVPVGPLITSLGLTPTDEPCFEDSEAELERQVDALEERIEALEDVVEALRGALAVPAAD